MKSISILLPSLSLAVFSTAALAQRESFDATVVRRADSIVVEMSDAAGRDGLNRTGMDASGKWIDFFASRESVAFQNIYFKLDSTELRDRASELQVDEIAAALKSSKLKGARFLIEGHTCDLGEADYNLKLSAQRAEAIRKLLVKKGVHADRLAVLGFGETELVERVTAEDAPSEAETKRMKSRRVVLRRILPSPPVR